ncbi:MAG: hypothetical protein PUD59_05795 [bacterium]|nr:hypothetical protein [bacterium]
MRKKFDEELMLEITKASLSNTEISNIIASNVVILYKYSVLLESGKSSDYDKIFESFLKELLEYDYYMHNLESCFKSLTKHNSYLIDYFRRLINERLSILMNTIKNNKRLEYVYNRINKMDEKEFKLLLLKAFTGNKSRNYSFLDNIDYFSLKKSYFELDKEILAKGILDTSMVNIITDVEENKIYSSHIFDMEFKAIETCIYNPKQVEKFDIYHINNNKPKVKTYEN